MALELYERKQQPLSRCFLGPVCRRGGACVSCVCRVVVSAHGCFQKAITFSFALMPTLTVLKSVGTSSHISENGHQKKTKVLGVGGAFSFQALAILASFLLPALWFYHNTTMKAPFFS